MDEDMLIRWREWCESKPGTYSKKEMWKMAQPGTRRRDEVSPLKFLVDEYMRQNGERILSWLNPTPPTELAYTLKVWATPTDAARAEIQTNGYLYSYMPPAFVMTALGMDHGTQAAAIELARHTSSWTKFVERLNAATEALPS